MVYTSAPCEFEKCKLVHSPLCNEKMNTWPEGWRTVPEPWSFHRGRRAVRPCLAASGPAPIGSHCSHTPHIKTNVLGQRQHREPFHQDDNTRPSAFHSRPDTDSEWNVTDIARLLSDLQMPVSVKRFQRKIKLRLYCLIHLECITEWRHEMELGSQLCGGFQRRPKWEKMKMAPTSPRSLQCDNWPF